MRNDREGLTLDLRGVDMVTPVDLLSDGRTPWSKNFRLYAQQPDDRQVAVSSRKGPGFHMSPLEETLSDYEETQDGSTPVGVTSNITAQKFESSTDGRLNRVDVMLRNPNMATGPVMVSLYVNRDERPSELLAQSSVGSGSIGTSFDWHTFRFHEAPLVEELDDLWIVVDIQDDGEGNYELGTSSTGYDAKFSESSFAALESVGWGMSFRAYTSPDMRDKGSYRFSGGSGVNTTVVAYGSTMYALDEVNDTWEVIDDTLDPLASEYSFTRGDGKVFWANGFDKLKAWDGDTVEEIEDPQLGILSMIAFHKDRLFGVDAVNGDFIRWSEAPSNPVDLPADQQWYNSWRSVDFYYVPRPMSGSPITGIESFQDSLVIFTEDSKYMLSGHDSGTFIMRQSTGSKGALSPRGITKDENFIYFVSDDGFYEFNGSQDTNITETTIQPLFTACPSKRDITPVVWQNKVRFYMASQTSTVNDMCAIYARGLGGEWEIDTGTYVNRALYYGDANDNQELIEYSSQYPMPMIAEHNYNSLGAPIDFEYRLKYDSFGSPASKKRIRRYYPILQGVDSTFRVGLAMDKDFEDDPRVKEELLTVNGSLWGDFNWSESGTLYGGDKSFEHHRQSYSGSAYYWQLRVLRKGVNNRVAFTGAQYKYRTKRM